MWTAERIRELIAENKLYRFYKSREWQQLRDRILREHHYECAWCKEKGKISRAETVHHMQWVKQHPELALQEWYTYKGKTYRNLVPLCHDCHDKAHERMQYRPRGRKVHEERW